MKLRCLRWERRNLSVSSPRRRLAGAGQGSPFDYLYCRKDVDRVLRRLYPREFRDASLSGIESNGFLLASHLRRMRAVVGGYLQGTERPLIVDLGCGVGGLGQWLSAVLKARLIGVDISPVAISRARCLFGQQRPRLRFVLAQCDATGLPCEQASAIVSWEVLHLVR